MILRPRELFYLALSGSKPERLAELGDKTYLKAALWLVSLAAKEDKSDDLVMQALATVSKAIDLANDAGPREVTSGS